LRMRIIENSSCAGDRHRSPIRPQAHRLQALAARIA
jgi:hypothetical protein